MQRKGIDVYGEDTGWVALKFRFVDQDPNSIGHETVAKVHIPEPSAPMLLIVKNEHSN